MCQNTYNYREKKKGKQCTNYPLTYCAFNNTININKYHSNKYKYYRYNND